MSQQTSTIISKVWCVQSAANVNSLIKYNTCHAVKANRKARLRA